jgi:Hsp70 protein
MSERYKVLGAMLALKEFNVADLALFSGVKANTVRTVLMRESALVDELGKEHTGSRGGQFARYQLKKNKVDGLRSEIRRLYDALDTCIGGKTEENASEYSAPLPLLTAEDALLLRFPRVNDVEAKVELIKFARTVEVQHTSRNRKEGKKADLLSKDLGFYLNSLRFLIDLCDAELLTASNPSISEYAAPIFRDVFRSLLKRGQQLGQANHCVRLMSRFLISPLLGQVAHTRDVVNEDGSFASFLGGVSDPRAVELIQSLHRLSEAFENDLSPDGTEATEDLPVSSTANQEAENPRLQTATVSELVGPGKVPLSISLETSGGVSTRIFARNTPLPTRRVEVFSTAADNQTEVEVSVYQGERYFARDNRKLGTFKLGGIRPATQGVPQIEVTFEMDVDGNLEVAAKDSLSGNHQEIALATAPKLSIQEISALIRDAEDHAAEDREHERQTEAQLAAQRAIHTADGSLLKYGRHAPDDLKAKIRAEIDLTKDLLTGKEVGELIASTGNLNELLAEFFSYTQGRDAIATEATAPEVEPAPEEHEARAADASFFRTR